VREALFNALGSLDAVNGARVLDLFAGSGALGIEALSRGADRATFVDTDQSARRAITTNLATTGLADRAEVVSVAAAVHLAGVVERATAPYDLVLLDPPYSTDDTTWRSILELVAEAAPEGIVVVESDREVAAPEGWDALRAKWYGGTLVTVHRTPSLSSEPS
jgi:16S rRNA (guanine966-N2)-methyltransferase